MVTPQRSSLSPYNVDMATFLNCNRDYVDITQCPKLSTNAAAERLPSNVLVNITQDLDDEFGSLENIFSAASMDLGLSDNEEGTEGLPHQERAGVFVYKFINTCDSDYERSRRVLFIVLLVPAIPLVGWQREFIQLLGLRDEFDLL
ncbi:hypothetical protein F443_18769 [Phytophthora nicotianae P1569]|uniref:Uncharacterized protein n=2 Tax=Phytophthora nicotianae TaxID=4792 RepID=V9E6V5_PHYNI|nr:hypothetical protein F443_18769 [Phytophthora nicotianae P1569]ETO58978.1 hypothetical protein F444_22645 [Phytophthora nicotianae P1976]